MNVRAKNKNYKPTFLALVRYLRQVDVVCSDDVIVDAIVVTKLDLDATAQRRKHLREDDLLVPYRLVRSLPDGGFCLQICKWDYKITLADPSALLLRRVQRCRTEYLARHRSRRQVDL